jgi:hypothetical protein
LPIPPSLFIFIGIIVGMVIFETIILKIGLSVSKAEVRKDFKWVFASFGIQIGLFLFIGSPIYLMLFAGAFQDGPPPLSIIIPLVIAFSVADVNVINVLHEIGIGKSIIVFILVGIPLIFFVILGSAFGSMFFSNLPF